MKVFNLKDYDGGRLEDEIFHDDVLLEKGLSLEAYTNFIDGIYDEESSEGSSLFFNLDESVMFGSLLDTLAKSGMGSIRKEELTIRIIADNEEDEIALASEVSISDLVKDLNK